MSPFAETIARTLVESLKEAVPVTLLVLVVMSVVEVFNVSSLGRHFLKLNGKPLLQILLACLLGAIPGCAGGFVVVSLFLQNMIVFPALVAGLVSTFGDEAIFLYTQSPKSGLITSASLFVVGVLAGIISFVLRRNTLLKSAETPVTHCHNHKAIPSDIALGKKILFFLREHVWNHIVKEHSLKIFLYIFITLFVIGVANEFVDLNAILSQNTIARWIVLFVAVIIGFLPVSGPHLVFVVLFLQGSLPFGILLANSISQNGHSGMQLLAASPKQFFRVKAISALIGLAVGALCVVVL